MIGPGISVPVADAARRSLDAQVNKLRDDGKLEAGKSTIEKLGWTDETIKAGDDFKSVRFVKSPHRS